MRGIFLLAMLAFAGCGAPPAQSTDIDADVTKETVLDVGSKAPAFELQGSDGKTHKLADYVGEHVVLAFFPKAFTSG